jgi:hypothetical protein
MDFPKTWIEVPEYEVDEPVRVNRRYARNATVSAVDAEVGSWMVDCSGAWVEVEPNRRPKSQLGWAAIEV